MSDFQDQHVVVTGASGGLGALVVARLLELGATCHLPMMESSVPTHLPWSAHARVHVRTSTLLDDDATARAYFDSLPRLDASVHLVGGFSMAPIADTLLTELDRLYRLNVVSCFLSSREAVRAIRRSGGKGRIVNVSARPALVPSGGMVAYSATKAAVASITQSLSAEVAAEGIFVNAIAPSIIDTAANRAAMPDADFATWPKPEEIAETIVFLASARNTLTSGCVVPVYGRA